ncbi:glycosyltransferase family 2 protein [Paraconexibacter antarcticus]|uniref:Glycosyltransferase family 2 protein n=1 Tax=Paraconexibacter antarcticus TaxID=2949664 RepID=A0ABY5DPQ4_9ACTN|nr:glycosyltransferase [Paraconexibacter antarcticus]UTI62700.1 glycosyltransferase family 2 protein [Paraconexibacter antarcticus]
MSAAEDADAARPAPALSVVVPSHDRPLRLRWLLNALAEQSAPAGSFEVLVAHDSAGPETDALLRSHPLAVTGTLRTLPFAPGTAGPAQKRNAAWRAAAAPTVLFTDDDCRPPATWVAAALDACAASPGAIVQGPTQVDPDELVVKLHAPHARTQVVELVGGEPSIWAQTCNIAYPRAVLEALGGFDEALPLAAGEDTDLAWRARDAGVPVAAAPAMLTYHCVEPASLLARARESWRWQHLPYLTRKHPEIRRSYAGGGYFWKPQHVRVPFLLAGAALLLRGRPLAALAAVLPWAVPSLPSYGTGLRGRARAVSELPAHAVLDVVEVAALARGSVRHRSLLL